LVRDVCYAQTPRVARIARHRAAAEWLETRAGERLEDVADVLAHHYVTALELARAAGQPTHGDDLRRNAIRCLALAADRALGLDSARAEANVRRALDIADDDDPERGRLLERWAQALLRLGRHREAQTALEEARTRYESGHDPVGAARVEIAMSTVVWSLGESGRRHALSAVALLEPLRVPELVDAYAELAGEYLVNAQLPESMDAAQRALDLAAERELPEPARALGFLGSSRTISGDRRGLDDLRRALDLAKQRNQSRDAAVIFANLINAVHLYEGPRAALEVTTEGIAFCVARGLTDMQLFLGVVALRSRLDCGQIDQVLAGVPEISASAVATGNGPVALGVHSLLAHLALHRGGGAAPNVDADELAAVNAEASSPFQVLARRSTAAQIYLVNGRLDDARELLTQLATSPRTKRETLYAILLPNLVRYALMVDDVQVAHQMIVGIEPFARLHTNALVASKAQLAEADGRTDDALRLYAEAAERWRDFGNVPELAYALLGLGRCLRSTDPAAASSPLSEARDLFADLGFEPALREVSALLD
ncbi:MAG TPA: tetratricopeptide repeat protein, partial [Jatrophihabitantaceae bacterium]|nr:tetratricopeptide repeat protein [Jatrophihabitantaceae bacterium]